MARRPQRIEGRTMNKYINRQNDEEIINLIVEILSNGNMEVETCNESVLVKLLELRKTPIKIKHSFRDVEKDYKDWVKGGCDDL